jgi:hypothetical protein
MFTGSADHTTWTDESTARVEIGGPAPVRTGLTAARRRQRDVDLDEIDLRVEDPAGDEWMAEAACKGRTSLFFGIAGERPERRVRRERTARRVCAECSVVEPCRERARSGRENGFWGGESEEERAAAGFPPRSISRRAVQQASSVRAEAS